ncbi:DegT/DnrJ/EryC1/StrS family aminotransferase [Mucilaginibacter boryungensis]|uniref:Aminotransferase class I/II-fold pyridoxal phosphate-dependent enzyme n=1 Tax=Mucilaginibacter boryungensis TaxID=768480 RepID=A0ABR9XEP1_9SPHI|nr:aminotransferase class I/II-fold pyridoxal phosphate-dependent enzyme [Mucilaginibacter boryungensis]MBE9665852.1 aminotransferase class I/II-fold pyridoxal phosphate-dependent enzyme [Mucilaginibacter boryungensis]
MNSKIWLSSPHMGGAEHQFVQEAFDTNWVAPLGPHVDGFEKDLSDFLGGNQHVAVLSSGTGALHLALVMLNIGPTDEVFCQSMTFSASANPIKYVGATPVFIDSEKDTWNIDPNYLEDAIKNRIADGKKPKAIIVVHLYGMPAKMKEITEIAGKYEIPVIEDAAEALGSHINGQMCGTMGTMSILSFNGNKIITTSGGGALVSSDKQYIDMSKFLATQARDDAPHYQHSHIGYNYRMSNISAGIGRGQMQVLPSRINKRRDIFDQYVTHFGGAPGVSFLEEPKGFFSNRWLSTLTIDPLKANGVTREKLRLALFENNIESRPLWKPMHLQPVFKNCLFFGNNVSDKLFENGLCLPSGSNLSDNDLERVFTIMKATFRF